ncbi:MAG: VIT family protein [Acuticoccus sp.]
MPKPSEMHRIDRIGWLRAAVLGANDGLVSTASLVVGVASAGSSAQTVLLAGVAGLTAGALSMAAGEYVSVSSQADTEEAETELERQELAADREGELDELTAIYVARGLDEALAREVAVKLSNTDALTAHLRDELGITREGRARPLQAAVVSALCFASGALLPILVALVTPAPLAIWVVFGATLLGLAVLGAVGAWTGGAPMLRGAVRVCLWGSAAMAITAAVGKVFGISA